MARCHPCAIRFHLPFTDSHLPLPSSPPQDGKLTQGARLMAGLGAGVSEALLIVTPFEVVKTRLQQQKGTDKALLKYRVRGASFVFSHFCVCCAAAQLSCVDACPAAQPCLTLCASASSSLGAPTSALCNCWIAS